MAHNGQKSIPLQIIHVLISLHRNRSIQGDEDLQLPQLHVLDKGAVYHPYFLTHTHDISYMLFFFFN